MGMQSIGRPTSPVTSDKNSIETVSGSTGLLQHEDLAAAELHLWLLGLVLVHLESAPTAQANQHDGPAESMGAVR